MAFSSNPHIFIPVIDQLGRLASFPSRQSRDNRGQICLAFLAPKGPAHPAHLYCKLMKAKPQRFGDFMLNFGGMLGRDMQA